MKENFKKVWDILVGVASILGLMLVVFPIPVNPVLATGVVGGLGFAFVIWLVIDFDNKNR